MIAPGADAIIDTGKQLRREMIVNDKYKLGALVRSGEVATFEAQEIATGLAYYVHLLSGPSTPSSASLTADVRARLAAAPEGSDSPLVEQGDYDGAPFVVTAAKPELLDLKQWIEAQPTPQGSSAQASSSFSSSDEPGEFTRMFQAGSNAMDEAATKEPSELARAASPPPAPAGGIRETPPAAGEPGEFTKMFASGGAGSAEAPAEPATPTPATSQPPARPQRPPEEPSQKTAGPERTPPPAAPAPTGEGEFTKMFREGSGSSEPASEPSSPSPRDEPAIGADEPGITAPESRVPADASPKPSVSPGSGREAATGQASPGPTSAGEFTRMFQGAPEAQPSALQPPSRPEAEAARPPAAPATPPPAAPSASSKPGATASGAEPPRDPGQQQGGQTGEFTTMFRLRPEKDAPKPSSPPAQGDSGISDSGLRRLSPEERREEMRQFRMISRGGAPPEPPKHPAAARPPAPVAPETAPSPPQQAAPAAPPSSQRPGAAQTPGEFTRLFQGGGAPPEPVAPPQAPSQAAPPQSGASERRSATELTRPGSPQAPSPHQAPGPPPQKEAGEFTRLFQSGSAPRPGSAGQPPAGEPQQQPASGGPGYGGGSPGQAGQTGEFTKLFREAKPAARTPEPPLAPQVPPSSGEFTRLFGSGMPGSPQGPGSSQPQPPPSREPAAGDFTRMFGGGGGAGSRGGDPFAGGPSGGQDPFSSPSGGHDTGRQPEPPEQQGGEFTRLFGGRGGQKPAGGDRWGSPGLEAEGATQISRKPTPPPAEPPPSQGPSDFTRMMGSGPGLPRQQAPAGQPAPPQAAPSQAPPQQAPPPQQQPGYPPPAYAPPAYATPPQAPPGYAPPAQAPPGYAQPAAPAAPQAQAPPPVAAQPPPQPAGGERERAGSDRSMYLIFALIFCALLLVALGVVLFVSLTSDSGQPAAQPTEAQQGAAQAPSTNVPSGLSSSVRAPSVSTPSVQGPSATAPSVSGSGISGGSLRAPSATAPSVSSPSLSTPSATAPRLPTGQVPAATPAQTTAPAAESSGTPFLALIIILSILLVIAVGAAVYFAVRRS